MTEEVRRARAEFQLLLLRLRGVRTHRELGALARARNSAVCGLDSENWYGRIERGDRRMITQNELRLVALALGAEFEVIRGAAEKAGY